jgi:hypothetical protein
MSHAKQVSKRKRRTKAVTALGVAGLLSLTGGASAENVDSAKDTSTENAAAHHEITLEEEEISDVTLGTFYLFDIAVTTAPIRYMRLRPIRSDKCPDSGRAFRSP